MLAFALLSVSAAEHSTLLSKWTDENGVFLSDSTDLTAEIFDIAGLLSLRPGSCSVRTEKAVDTTRTQR